MESERRKVGVSTLQLARRYRDPHMKLNVVKKMPKIVRWTIGTDFTMLPSTFLMTKLSLDASTKNKISKNRS